MDKYTQHHVFGRIFVLLPILYLNEVQIHQMRLMIVRKGPSDSVAAYQAGYNIASQLTVN